MNPKTFDDLPDNNAPLPLDDFKIISPENEDLMEEVEHLEAFRAYRRDQPGDSLTFGDY